jgi:hypothetical protein
VPKKPLIETNPYLRDADKCHKGLISNVSSNTSIETGRKPGTIARTLNRAALAASLKTRRGSGR